MQFGEGGAGTFSDGKLYSQIKDPKHLRPQGARRIRQGRRAGRDPVSGQAAYRHVPAGEHGREDARDHRGSWAANPFRSSASTISRSTQRPGARRWCWRTARRCAATTWCWRSATARAIPSRCCTSAASTWKQSRFRSVSVSSIRKSVIDRSRFGNSPGTTDPGRGRLQAGASLQQRPLGLQLLHVPGRHGGGGDVRAGPRRHQRHEPVFAQRAQRQRRHRGRHYAGRLSGRSAGRHRVPAHSGKSAAFELGGGDYWRRASWSATFIAGGRPALGVVEPSYKPGVHPTDLSTALPDYVIEAIRESLPQIDKKIPGSQCTTPC